MIKAVIFDLLGLFVGVPDGEKDKLITLASQIKKQRAKVFILSNLYEDDYAFLDGITDGRYFAGQTGFVKPDERAYRLILDENDIKPEECLYFDDSDGNVEVASGLGIHAFKFEGAEKLKEILAEQDFG